MVKMKQAGYGALAADLARNSIVTEALARFLEQVTAEAATHARSAALTDAITQCRRVENEFREHRDDPDASSRIRGVLDCIAAIEALG